jgi:dihydrodipicolinate synthase/N-acetylneuraminate lyase
VTTGSAPGRRLRYVCRTASTYDPAGRVDAVAFKAYLQRFVEPDIGVYIASSSSGAGQALTLDELGQLYRAAVEVGTGSITVGANIPEQFTSSLSIAHARLARECGVDVINIYGPDGRHGYRPTEAEYVRYLERVLSEVEHPFSLCPNPTLGYLPAPSVVATITREFPHVENVILSGVPDDAYFLELSELVEHRVDIYVGTVGSLNPLLLGAAGLSGFAANLIPRTYRRYLDAVTAGDLEAAAGAYRDIRRIETFASRQRPAHGFPRWHIMFLRALGLPGRDGSVPDPYLMPGPEDFERFTRELLSLGVREIDELAAAAASPT